MNYFTTEDTKDTEKTKASKS